MPTHMLVYGNGYPPHAYICIFAIPMRLFSDIDTLGPMHRHIYIIAYNHVHQGIK